MLINDTVHSLNQPVQLQTQLAENELVRFQNLLDSLQMDTQDLDVYVFPSPDYQKKFYELVKTQNRYF